VDTSIAATNANIARGSISTSVRDTDTGTDTGATVIGATVTVIGATVIATGDARRVV
jgi:hypothetical protein